MKEIFEISKLQNLLLESFYRLSQKEAAELHSLLAHGAMERGFTYQREGGVIEAINLMLIPSFYTDEQVSYLHGISLAVKRGIEAVYRAWPGDERLAAMLPFDEDEGRWIKAVRRPSKCPEPIWYRLDSHLHMKERGWKDNISIFEINSCAVGGIHYGPVAEGLFLDTVLPVIGKYAKTIPSFKKNPDLRDLLLGLISRHAKDMGRKTLNIIFAEDMTATEGITEGPYIVEHLRKKGANITLADPRELSVKGDDVYYKDMPVDIVYRNFELREIMGMEQNGDDTSGIKKAFSNNQAVSSLCGDFDHKSMWEVLASGSFDGYFSKEDAMLFKKHLLWTRIVTERKTQGPEGLEVDLIPYALKNRETLVLKPNRLCGGYGVTIGRYTREGDWQAVLEAGLKEEGGWVVQRFGAPEEFTFPLFENGELAFEGHNIVYGLSSTPEGTGILGRVSVRNVVNVAQHGGLMPVLRIA